MHFTRSAPLLLIALLASCNAGLIGDTLDTPPPAEDPTVLFACAEPEVVTPTPMRRLTKRQIEGTLVAVFGEALTSRVRLPLSALPNDDLVDSAKDFVTRYSDVHLEVLLDVALQLATAVTDSTADRALIFGSCADDATLSDACVNAFADTTAVRLYRGALTQDDKAALHAAAASGTSRDESLQNLLVTALIGPRFLYQVELGVSEPDAQRVLRLSQDELASRLAYLIGDVPPDDVLRGLAHDGRLADPAVLDAQVLRLLELPSGRAKVARFFSYWLKLDKPFELNVGQPFADGVVLDGLAAEAVRETKELIEHLVWDERGAYRDLLTSTRSFARSEALAGIYGHPLSSGEQHMTGARRGVLLRLPILASGSERTHPIVRGAFFRRRILCDVIPSPDPSTIAAAEQSISPAELAALSSRGQAEMKTRSADCAACHHRINPAGFALETFDALGRETSLEKRYDGDTATTFPIDARVELPIDEDTIAVDGAGELIDAIADSEAGPACLVRQALRFYHVREETRTDACVMRGAFDAMTTTGGSLVDAIKAMVLNDSTSVRRLDAQ